MKTFIAISSLIFASSTFAAGKTTILQKDFLENGKTIELNSFSPHSSFGAVSSEFCYTGKAKNVCSLAAKDAKDSQEEYSSGAHSYTEINSCDVEGALVTIEYLVSDDYSGDEEGTAVIAACTK